MFILITCSYSTSGAQRVYDRCIWYTTEDTDCLSLLLCNFNKDSICMFSCFLCGGCGLSPHSHAPSSALTPTRLRLTSSWMARPSWPSTSAISLPSQLSRLDDRSAGSLFFDKRRWLNPRADDDRARLLQVSPVRDSTADLHTPHAPPPAY